MKVIVLRSMLIGITILFIIAFSMLSLFSSANGPVWKVDSSGNITTNGNIYHINGASWLGLEGREEPTNDSHSEDVAPMELYIGNVFWQPSNRTHDFDITEFKHMGINTIRLPIVPQTLDPDDPQSQIKYKKNSASVLYTNSYLELCSVIKKLDAAGINIVIDIHSCSNYVGWRKGRFDARPPFVDRDLQNYDFKRENCSCAESNNPSGVTKIQAYNKAKWLANLKTIAALSKELGVKNIMGIDIFNEPHDYSWTEWKGYIEDAYKMISAVDPNILIFAEGVGSINGTQDGTPNTYNESPHGNKDYVPNWGENLYEAAENPPNIPKEKLVFSPHTFGPSLYVQKMFMDPTQPECIGLEGEAAAKNKCNIVINPEILEKGWEEHFGYLKNMGYAVAIGAWGGNMEWPNKTELHIQDMFGYVTDKTVDWQWQQAFSNYLIKKGIVNTFYYAINPESFYSGGLYKHDYDPISNKAGWGTWGNINKDKMNLFRKIWYSFETTPPTETNLSSSTIITPTVGDVNLDGKISSTDVALIERHFLGISKLSDNSFTLADVNKDGKITSTDVALCERYMLGNTTY